MLTALATNFGVSPSEISFRHYGNENLVILNGRFTVDATDSAYLSAGVLRITLPDIGWKKSHETSVYVLNTKDGAHDVTVTRAWVEDGNTLCIIPVPEYEPLGQYEICVLGAFIKQNVAGDVLYGTHRSHTPVMTRGDLANADIQSVHSDRWAMLMMTAQSITFDETEEDMVATLPDFPSINLDFLPVIYTGNVFDTYGSKFYPASLQNGVLTVSRDGVTGDTGTTFSKFIKVFIAVDQTDVPD